MKKPLMILAAAVLLLHCFVFTSFADDTADTAELLYSEIPVGSFEISELSPGIVTGLDYTDWWYSEWDDCRYVFLPSTADLSRLVITYSSEETLYLGESAVVSGRETDILSTADTFDIRVGKQDCGKLRIMQSDLGCIYLSTEKYGLDRLDMNRYLVETGNALMLDKDGTIVYSGEIEKLTSRGNSSWDYSQKKPYNLKLPRKADLYGMGKAKKWALVSNCLDHSMLRNKAAEEMCRAADMECVMDSVFVDLYADGAYRGTYQLCERVQIQKNRVNIRDLEEETEELNDCDLEDYPHKLSGAGAFTDYIENSYKYYDIPNDPSDITGGYLLQFCQWNRYGTKCVSGFVTSRGQAIAIDGPEYASKAQTEYIRSFVQDAEDAIYSENGYNSKGRHYSEYIDVDSLIRAYLVQEITENPDGTYSSFFVWKDSDLTGDGKLHFSPAWDFDLSLGNFPNTRKNSEGDTGYSGNPENLFISCFPIHGYDDSGLSSSTGSGRPTVGISWVGKLCKNEVFTEQAAEVYYESFEPFLKELTDGDTPYMQELAESIHTSADMNNARWHMFGGKPYAVFSPVTSGKDFMDSVRLVREFLAKRHSYLSKHWQTYKYVHGDVNSDGGFTVADAVLLQKWLLGAPDTGLAHWRAGDLCKDGRLDTFDLCLMRKALTE